MRGFSNIFWILAGFFVLAAVIYSTWTYAYDAQKLATDPTNGEGAAAVEWVGTVGLTLCGVLAVLIGFYLRRSHRGQGGELPEDIDDAVIEDGAGELGHFSPWSWWPLLVAAS